MQGLPRNCPDIVLKIQAGLRFGHILALFADFGCQAGGPVGIIDIDIDTDIYIYMYVHIYVHIIYIYIFIYTYIGDCGT